MIIQYSEKNNDFNDEEIDLIYRSTDSIVVKRLIDRHRNTQTYFIINILITSMICLAFVPIAFHSALSGQFGLFYFAIFMCTYICAELCLYIISNRTIMLTRLINKMIRLVYTPSKTRILQRRLKIRYRIYITADDYARINADYVNLCDTYDGQHFLKVSNNKIYFNPIGYYIKKREDHYCEIIENLQRQLKI